MPVTCLAWMPAGVGEPVVGVDYVEVDCACYHACGDRVVVDLLEQVVGIASRKFDAAEIVGAHVVEVGVYVVAQTEIEAGIHQPAYARVDVVAAHVAPGYRHLRCAYDVGEMLVLITERLGYHESDVHVAALPHAFGEAVAGGA